MEEVHSFNLTIRPSTQVVDDKLFFLSDLSDIFELTKGEDPKLFFSLDEAGIIYELVDFHMENDSTYPFMGREYAEPLNYYIENFYVSETHLHLVVVVVLPYLVTYKQQDAQLMRQFCTYLKLRLPDKSMEVLRSLSVTLTDYNSHDTNIPSAILGFKVLKDESLIIRNLTFTANKDSIPELLKIDSFNNFRLHAEPLTYYHNIPGKEFTTTYGSFYGIDSKRYCNEYETIVFSESGEMTRLINEHPKMDEVVIANSDTFNNGLFHYRCIRNKNSDELSLEILRDDSVLARQGVGKFKSEVITFNFINDEAWFLNTDTTSNGFILRQFSLGY